MSLDSGMEKPRSREKTLSNELQAQINENKKLHNQIQQLEDRLDTARSLIKDLVDHALKVTAQTDS